jgi:hypothetical protein
MMFDFRLDKPEVLQILAGLRTMSAATETAKRLPELASNLMQTAVPILNSLPQQLGNHQASVWTSVNEANRTPVIAIPRVKYVNEGPADIEGAVEVARPARLQAKPGIGAPKPTPSG